MKRKLIILLFVMGIGVSTYAQELSAVVTQKETYESGWTYIDYTITNLTEKTGWIYVTIIWVDQSGREHQESGTLSITAKGYKSERFGIQDYYCCAKVEAWFKE